MRHKIRLLAGLLFLMAAGTALFSFAMFQGDRVSWFLFFGFLPVFLYEVLMLLIPFRNWKVERFLSAALLEAGGRTEVKLSLKRKWGFPIFMAVVEEIFPESLQFGVLSDKGSSSIRMKRLLFPGFARKLELQYTIGAVPRGVHELVGIRFMVSDLFGLVKKEYTIPASNTLIGYPKERLFLGYDENFTAREGSKTGLPSLNATVIAAGARAYVPGDRITSIDWKKTARLQEMMTKEFEQETGREILLILDACPFDGMDGTAFELSIEIALGLIRLESNKATGIFITIGKETNVFSFSNQDAETRILHHLAEMKQNARRPFSVRLAEEFQYSTGSKDIIIITSNINAELAETAMQLKFQNGEVSIIYVKPSADTSGRSAMAIEELRKNGVHFLQYEDSQTAGGGK